MLFGFGLEIDKMINKTLFVVSILSIILILSMSQSSAIQFFQWKFYKNDNVTTRSHISVTYDESNKDTVKSGDAYESYIWYTTTPDVWNNANKNNTVYYCTFTITYSSHMNNGTQILYQQNYTTTLKDGKYFVRLQKGDSYYADFDCVFTSPQARILDIPATMSFVAPTYECGACQLYNWNKDFIKITKAKTLSDYTTQNVGYMKGIINLMYDFAIWLFWILLILLVLSAVGLIFIGVLWVYKYISGVIK